MNSVFLLQHLHTLPHGEDDLKTIGIYRSRAAALSAAERLASQPGFCDVPQIIHPDHQDPQGFHIDEYRLDQDHWAEGYVTE